MYVVIIHASICVHMHKENSNQWIIYFRCVWNVDNMYTAVLSVKDYPLNSHAWDLNMTTHMASSLNVSQGLQKPFQVIFQVLNCLEEITMLYANRWLAKSQNSIVDTTTLMFCASQTIGLM